MTNNTQSWFYAVRCSSAIGKIFHQDRIPVRRTVEEFSGQASRFSMEWHLMKARTPSPDGDHDFKI